MDTVLGGQKRTHGSIIECARVDSFKTAVPPGQYAINWIIGGGINLDVGDGCVRLLYDIADQSISERVELSTVPNHYGGSRSFFLCPGCDRRVRFLYRPWERLRFRCRSCWRLNYPSQQETPGAVGPYRKGVKLLLERFKLPLDKIPGPGRFYGYIPPRPKGMHWHTYSKLCRELELLQGDYERNRYISTHKIGRHIIWTDEAKAVLEW